MRRKIATAAVLGGLAAGLGCYHIGGTSDCGWQPADYPIGPPTPAYPIYPVPAASADPIPKSKDGVPDKDAKKDEKKVEEKKDGGN
ncbi:MAG: hypothetical protein C0501_30345 [Isosphaera sp.]|nr:hypothetical protein [Isosphaera sp.]